jgi:ABC-2 type transport system permease protein
MKDPTIALSDSSLESPVAPPAAVSPTRRMYWSLRRELWEARSIFIAPMAAATFFLPHFLVGLARLPEKMRKTAAFDSMRQHAAIVGPYNGIAGLLMLIVMIVGAFYCIDALYGERRDRSILFWKSLPVSNLTTVLAKMSVPVVILPLFAFLVTVVTQFIMLLVSSAVLASNGLSVAPFWHQLAFVRMSMLLLYHLVTVHGLWPAPVFAWFLLVSAWARRAPFVWAFVPPAAICYLEKLAFNTTHFTALLKSLMMGGGMEALTAPGTFPMDPMTHLTPGRYLSSPGLWLGLLFASVFLAVAVRLRRYRGPI